MPVVSTIEAFRVHSFRAIGAANTRRRREKTNSWKFLDYVSYDMKPSKAGDPTAEREPHRLR